VRKLVRLFSLSIVVATYCVATTIQMTAKDDQHSRLEQDWNRADELSGHREWLMRRI
jgi:hypothetical protein